jgi:large subunit ribosomal protein L10
MKKTEKSLFVQNLTEEIKSASSVVLVNYEGLSVKMQQDLKRKLSGVGANLSIVKNTLFRLAARSAKSPKEILVDSVLTGPSALVISEQDPIAPLQVIANFAKKFDIPQFKVGIIEGTFYDKKNLAKLSKLSGKDALVANAVGAIASPMYRLTYTLQANMQKLVSLLTQATENNQESEGR